MDLQYTMEKLRKQALAMDWTKKVKIPGIFTSKNDAKTKTNANRKSTVSHLVMRSPKPGASKSQKWNQIRKNPGTHGGESGQATCKSPRFMPGNHCNSSRFPERNIPVEVLGREDLGTDPDWFLLESRQKSGNRDQSDNWVIGENRGDFRRGLHLDSSAQGRDSGGWLCDVGDFVSSDEYVNYEGHDLSDENPEQDSTGTALRVKSTKCSHRDVFDEEHLEIDPGSLDKLVSNSSNGKKSSQPDTIRKHVSVKAPVSKMYDATAPAENTGEKETEYICMHNQIRGVTSSQTTGGHSKMISTGAPSGPKANLKEGTPTGLGAQQGASAQGMEGKGPVVQTENKPLGLDNATISHGQLDKTQGVNGTGGGNVTGGANKGDTSDNANLGDPIEVGKKQVGAPSQGRGEVDHLIDEADSKALINDESSRPSYLFQKVKVRAEQGTAVECAVSFEEDDTLLSSVGKKREDKRQCTNKTSHSQADQSHQRCPQQIAYKTEIGDSTSGPRLGTNSVFDQARFHKQSDQYKSFRAPQELNASQRRVKFGEWVPRSIALAKMSRKSRSLDDLLDRSPGFGATPWELYTQKAEFPTLRKSTRGNWMTRTKARIRNFFSSQSSHSNATLSPQRADKFGFRGHGISCPPGQAVRLGDFREDAVYNSNNSAKSYSTMQNGLSNGSSPCKPHGQPVSFRKDSTGKGSYARNEEKQINGSAAKQHHTSHDSGFDQMTVKSASSLTPINEKPDVASLENAINHVAAKNGNLQDASATYKSLDCIANEWEQHRAFDPLRCPSLNSLDWDQSVASLATDDDENFRSYMDDISTPFIQKSASQDNLGSAMMTPMTERKFSTSTPKSKSCHDLSTQSRHERSPPMKQKLCHRASVETDSSVSTMPRSTTKILKDSLQIRDTRRGYLSGACRQKLELSRSVEVLSGDRSRSSRGYRSRERDAHDSDLIRSGYASQDWERVRKEIVSMAASAAYIPGASLSDKLRLAASKGHVEKIHELIQSGAVQDADREGRTALHYAALNGHAEIVHILADEGADINSQDTLGYTALHRAAAQGHLEVIKVLLSEACLLNRQDEVHGNSPLHEAAWNGYSRTLEVLLKHNANVHCVNKAGFSALHLAAQNGHNQSARVLLYAGCHGDLKNNYGDTALHTAARYGHAGVTRILISARCNIAQQNKNGDTALHISAALKRRKLSKLLTESGINTSLKNKQNETAVDVARRKDHPDIILIITSQHKNSKKNKKSKEKSKKGKENLMNGEETEKKGYFFKRKTKKSQQPQEKEKIVVETRPRTTEHHSAPSEISSSDFTSQMAPEELLRGFRQTMAPSGRPHREREHVHVASARGTSTRGTKAAAAAGGGKVPVKGLLSEYTPKNGTQYYKDLAGNLKQGPIGYAPVCNCKPIIKKLEKRMENDRNNLYDHIDASHKTLTSKIDGLDKQSAQQVYSIDKLTKERIDAEAKERKRYVHACIAKDRMEVQENCEQHHTKMRTHLEGHIDKRFTNYEQFYSGRHGNAAQDPCYWCYGNENHNVPHYHQDDMLNQNYMSYDPEEPPPPGKLYKSKSDETLSVASSHHSRKHWKLRSNAIANRDITDMKLAQVMERAQRMERKIRSQSAGVQAKGPPTASHRSGSMPAARYGVRGPGPERGSTDNLQADYYSYKDYVAQQHQWNAKRAPVNMKPDEHFHDVPREAQLGSNQPEPPRRQRPASQLNPPPQTHAFNGHIQGAPARETHVPGSEPIRTRSSSTTRVPDVTMHQVPHTTSTLPRPREGRPASTVYNMNSSNYGNVAHQPMNGPSRLMPSQTEPSYGSRSQVVPNEGQSQRHLQVNRPPEEPPRTNNAAPSSTSANTSIPASTPTPTGPAPSLWNPLHTSSPDTQPQFTTPDSSASVLSSQNSTPLYPSPAVALGKTRSETSSNPDSGYGCRLFGGRQISGPQLPGSTSSSFQSSHGHNNSVNTSNTSHNDTTSPVVQYEREPRRANQQPNSSDSRPQQASYQRQAVYGGVQSQQYNSVPGTAGRRQVIDFTPQQNSDSRAWTAARGQTPAPAQSRGQRHESGHGFIGKATQV